MQHQRSLRGLIGSSISRPYFLRLYTHPVTCRYQSSNSDDAPLWPAEDWDDLEEKEQSKRTIDRKVHQSKRAGSIPIGVDSLGEPGKIIVLPPKRRRKRKQAKDEPQSSLLSSMLDDLDSEVLGGCSESVQKAFDSFRGELNPSQKLASDAWEEVRSRLASSFTWEQLSNYVDQNIYSSLGTEAAEQWRPGKSAFLLANPMNQDAVDRVTSSLDLKGKHILAERILRNCWQLAKGDEIGQLDLHMPHFALELLLNSLNFSFDSVAKMSQSSIDITLSLGLVRITGTESACQHIREIIADASARIREDTINIDPEASVSALTPQFLDWIKQTYEVSFEGKANVLQKVYYLAENKQGADNARRALNLAIYNSNQPRRSFATYLPSTQQADLYTYNSPNNLSWLDREKSWFRWATPPVQASTIGSPQELFYDNHPTQISDQLLKVLRRNSTLPIESESGVKLHESVTAAVGQCLFAQKSPFTNTSFSAPELGGLSLDRKFVNDIPRINPFLESLKHVHIGTDYQLRRVRLIPPPSASETLPELEIEFFAMSTEHSENLDEIHDIIDIKQVKAIYETSGIEYLLPENGLDVHFTRTVYRKISHVALSKLPEYESLAESIKAPLREASLATNDSSTSIPLPAFCHVSLPRELASATTSTTPSDSNITVAYTFPILDDARDTAVHQYEFDARVLNFCLLERGPFNPSRIELSMDINLSNQGADGDSEDVANDAFHSFYKDSCDMAFEVHQAQTTPAE
ncbi:hypothetical protein N7495_003101 [Penicillium taxi]|uniref:uncharacterized protein n=1 Tax=Penicillium taxi TaxID=168475 RepID=UPI002544D60E|nr:uncharacterized protein N7495_003101 [Penicillium taxi]KAJ5902573.1 hypothetical protein N7495_003101 [Penicillium taxi]